MRKISFWLSLLILTVSLARAQDAATQQQIDKLSGQYQDLLATQEQQSKQLDALEKKINELADKVSTPAANASASADDLKSLATQVQEIDKKRQEDRDLILKEIEKLGKVGGGTTTSHKPKTNPDTTAATGDDSTASAVPQKGYDYTIASGDTISAIAKAYREKGVKVTSSQILRANPKLDPSKMYVGQKIFIPDPNAK